jgi:hypothetical protein
MKNRITRVLAALVMLLGAAGVLVGAPAHAGSGPSQLCDDGTGTEHPIITNPITLSTEVDSTAVGICWSTTPLGTPGGVTGGLIAVYWNASTSTMTVTMSGVCQPDSGVVVSPTCNVTTTGASAGSASESGNWTTTHSYASDTGGPCLWVLGTQELATCTSAAQVTYAAGDLPQEQTDGVNHCLMNVNGTCFVSTTGVTIWTGYNTMEPTLEINTTYTGDRQVNIPQECLGVFNSGSGGC